MDSSIYITVDEVVRWAAKEDIFLGKNPKRTLVYLAGRGIIPKTIKGANCKGVYKKDEVLPRLTFYHNRRKEGWRIHDILVAISRLNEARSEATDVFPLSEVLMEKVQRDILVLPVSDSFKSLFLEFLAKNPSSAASLIQFLDEQEMLSGVKIGSAFRKLVGLENFHASEEWQSRINFHEV